MVPPPTISVVCKATTLFAMPVRLLTQSVMRWPLELLPLSCDALVLTPAEHEALLAGGSRFANELRRDARWVWSRPLSHSYDPAV